MNIYLTSLRPTDAEAINEHMRDKEISDNTLVIPFPYTIDDAHAFLERTKQQAEERGAEKNFAIRSDDGELMGLIGLHFNYGVDADKSEFGYWLGKKHWNKGVMTKAILLFSELVKEKYKIQQLEADVFHFNNTSMHVLEKCGFTRTGGTVTHTKLNGEKVKGISYMKEI